MSEPLLMTLLLLVHEVYESFSYLALSYEALSFEALSYEALS